MNAEKMQKDLEKLLISIEKKYGIVRNVPRKVVSKHDPRSTKQIITGGMIGGDRMIINQYAKKYAANLLKFIGIDDLTIVEVGILKGNGLAMWKDLFPSSIVYGCDIDLEHTKNNMHNLTKLGGFNAGLPILFEYDQFEDGANVLLNHFKKKSIDICVDDGFHSDETCIKTFRSFFHFMKDRFVYFIEDNTSIYKIISKEYPHLQVSYSNKLTVITHHATFDFAALG